MGLAGQTQINNSCGSSAMSGVVVVQMDSFRSTVVVTLSVNVMCIHICIIVV